jgi:branched-chain amino acid transport system substrate-binding protein
MWGNMFKNSMELALDEAKWEAAGKPIKLVIEDEGGEDVTMALDKAKKLVQSDKVGMVMGPFYGGSAFSVMPYTSSLPIVNVKWSQPGIRKEELGNKYAFWVPQTYNDNTYPVGLYAYEVKGIKSVVTLGSDYSCGYDFMQGFTDAFKAKGGNVVQQQWAPLTEQDYTPYLSALKPADALVLSTLGPPNHLAVIKQFGELGLSKKMSIFIAEVGTMPPPIMQQLGDKIIGVTGVEKFMPSLESPEAKRFLQAYTNKYKEEPDDKACDAYNGMKVVLAALNTTGGDTKPDTLKQALLKVELELPTGKFKFSEGRIGMQPLRVCEIQKIGGKYGWKVMKEYSPEPPHYQTYP